MNTKQRTGIVVGLLLIAIIWGAIFILSGSVAAPTTVLPTEAAINASVPAQSVGLRAPAAPTPMTITVPQDPIPQQVVIRFSPDADATVRAAYIAAIGGTVIEMIDVLDTVVITVPADVTVQTLPSTSIIVSAEPNYVVTALDYVVPNDVYFPQQWGLTAIGAPEVWETVAGIQVIIVAVIDSGIDSTHPDLTGRILSGYDFVDNDLLAQDVSGHGTAVAGIIAANRGNEIGIAGVAPNARIMPLRVLDASGVGTYADVASAIIYATDNGAQVINLSLGGQYPSTMLENAVNYAASRGVLVVAAAGNNGQDGALYPAAFTGAIGVGSVDRTLQRSVFSNYGTTVSVYAPGSDIITTGANGSYVTATGTSYAAPHVAGIAALELGRGGTFTVDGGMVRIAAPIGDATPTAEPDSPDDGDQTVTAQAMTCTFEQITDTTGGNYLVTTISGDGGRVAFLSSADVVPGGNTDANWEVFLWDSVTGIVQITETTGGLLRLSTPQISSDGNRIAFSSGANLTGSNADGSDELFLWDRVEGLTQITGIPSSEHTLVGVSISADGSHIAFDSSADIVSGQNTDNSTEAFLWDETTGFIQLTNQPNPLQTFTSGVSSDGSRVALFGSGDLVGQNADGNTEIFIWENGVGIQQITDTTTTGNAFISINHTGDRLFFRSDSDLTGQNADANWEMFMWDGVGFTQITVSSTGSSFPGATNAAGTRYAFTGTFDLTGGNGDGNNEVFLWDEIEGISQITDTVGFTAMIDVALSGDGQHLAFQSNADFTGNNADGSEEVFGVSCVDTAPTIVDQPRSPSILSGGQATLFVSPASEFGLTYQWYQGIVGDTSTPVSTERLLTTATLTSTTQYWVRISNGVGSVDSIAAVVTVVEPSGEVCETAQLTSSNGEDTFQPDLPLISDNGSRVLFRSQMDITGGNPSNDIALFIWDSATGFTQISNNIYFGNAFANADLSRVLFSSTDNFTGENGDGGGELFIWDNSTGYVQITNNMDTSGFYAIDATGNYIVFVVTDNLTGNNPDGSEEIFLWNATTDTFTQVTNLLSSSNAVGPFFFSEDGTHIAFTSFEDLTGGNPDNRNTLFVQVIGGTLSQVATVADTEASGFFQFSNVAGGRVFFSVAADPVGSNTDLNIELFMWDETTGITQITNSVHDEPWFNLPNIREINDDGTRLTFSTGFGYYLVEEIEVWQWREGEGVVQITDTNIPGDYILPANVNNDGTRILLYGNTNLTGFNVDNNYGVHAIWDENTGFMHILDPFPIPAPVFLGSVMSGDGQHFTLWSPDDYTGQNPDGDWELFLISCGQLAAPTITQQPSHQNINSSETATFTVSADGFPALTYQWYQGEVGDTSTPVGTNSPSFTTPALTESIGYWVRVSNSQGFVDSEAAVASVVLAQPPHCTITQITDTQSVGIDAGGGPPVVSADGTRIAFTTMAVLTPDDIDGQMSIYIWDEGVGYTYVTAGWWHDMSDDGTRIAFTSAQDLTGGNPDGYTEAFLWDETTDTITQVSDTPGYPESVRFGVAISGDGTRASFIVQYETGNYQTWYTNLYLWDEVSGVQAITSETVGREGGLAPALNYDGTRLAFEYSGNPIGQNADLNAEIFIWIDGLGIRQLTDTLLTPDPDDFDGNYVPSINAAGDRVGFLSTYNLTGQNADLSAEHYVVDIFVEEIPTFDYTQISNGTIDVTNTAGAIVMDATGEFTSFMTSYDLTGGNPDNNSEFFLWNQGVGFRQITNTTHDSTGDIFDMSADGTHIVFRSQANLTGSNSDENFEVYLAFCEQPPAIVEQPQHQSIAEGGQATFTITVNGTDLQYQWYQGDVGDTSTPVGTDNSTFITPSLTVSTRYWVRVSNALGTEDSAAVVASVMHTQPPYCTFTQITDTTGVTLTYGLDITADGSRIVFIAGGNFTGENPDGSDELFLWDESTGFVQITQNFSGGSYSSPSISDDGKRIAFISDHDIIPGSNPDVDKQVFLWDEITGFTQITTGENDFRGSVVISGDGTHIVYITVDPVPIGYQLFMWEDGVGSQMLTNIPANLVVWQLSPYAINQDGSRVVLEANGDLTGQNADRNGEIFIWDEVQGFIQVTVTPSSDTDGIEPDNSFYDNVIPAINAVGDRIVFISNRDITGNNADGNHEYFLWDETAGFTQLTNEGFDIFNSEADGSITINGIGDTFAVMMSFDPTGSNPDHNTEYFLWRSGSDFTQITNTTTTAIGHYTVLSTDGNHLAMLYPANLTGGNPDENYEVYLAECEDVPVPPVILDQPDDVIINSGQSTTLNVVAAGDAPLTYQWYQGVAGNTSTPVGTNSTSFTTPALTQTTQYWVRVSNAAGSVNSRTATITVNQPPIITQQPASQSILSGETATMTVVATGTMPLHYQWYQGTTGDTSIPVGTDSPSFTTPALTATTDYWVRVSNIVSSVDSVTATITVQTPPTITDQPDDQTINSWWTATLNVTATGDAPLSYQWYQGTTGDTSTPVGTDSPSFTTPALTATTAYWVRVSNAVGFADSDTATITVVDSPPLAITDLTLNGVTQTQIGLVWSQNDPTVAFYQVQHSTDGTNWSLLISVTVPTTFFTHTGLNCNTTHYYRVIAQRTFDGSSSAPSNEVNATTTACIGLNAPTNLVATAMGRDRIALSWANPNPPGEVTHFYLEVSPDGTNWAGLMSFNGTTLSYNHTGLTCTTTYHYRLRAFRIADGQYTAYTPTASATTSPCPIAVENTIGLYRDGVWQFRDANSSGEADVIFTFGPRQPGWIALVGDWNGDGVDGIGLYQNGVWLLRDVAGAGVQDYVFVYGPRETGWTPVVGDWNGDDIDTVGVVRNGSWLLRNSNSGGTFDIAVSFPPGGTNWRPISGDWDGNGIDSIGYYANGMWYLHNSLTHTNRVPGFTFGLTTGGWLPISADWNADGTDTIGIYQDGVWRMRNSNAAGAPDLGFTFGRGLAGWQPLAGYRDNVGGTGLGILSVAPPIQLPGESTPVPPPVVTTPAPIATDTPTPTDLPTDISTDVPESTPDVSPPTDTPTATVTPDPTETPLPESTAEPSP